MRASQITKGSHKIVVEPLPLVASHFLCVEVAQLAYERMMPVEFVLDGHRYRCEPMDVSNALAATVREIAATPEEKTQP